MELIFGKKVKCGNFYIIKKSASLTKKEVASIRRGMKIPVDALRHLQRGSIPYIKVSTMSESWSVTLMVGMNMYSFLDTMEVSVDKEGNYSVDEKERGVIENIIVHMYTDTTIVGDIEYYMAKLKLINAFINRESQRRAAADKEGKSEEQLRKESEEAVQEVIDRDGHASTLLDMAEQIAKEEEGGER